VHNTVEAAATRLRLASGRPQRLPINEVTEAYRNSSDRLIFLDYDGTLVPYANRAKDAVPTPELTRILRGLAAGAGNSVVIVSGREKAELDRWFGRIPGLWLAAEHGAVIRSPSERSWTHSHANVTDEWKKDVHDVLEHFADRTPGSYVEEKEFSLVWHYRMADPEFGEWLANELNSTLDELLADTQLRAIHGRKNIEVKLIWATKADVLAHLKQEVPDFDFVLAAGDDKTDEDLFEKMSPDMWSVHIGNEQTAARFRLRDFREMRELLASFTELQPHEEKVKAVKTST
jgi:trehalose 6-phosphate synthase/phosphatase